MIKKSRLRKRRDFSLGNTSNCEQPLQQCPNNISPNDLIRIPAPCKILKKGFLFQFALTIIPCGYFFLLTNFHISIHNVPIADMSTQIPNDIKDNCSIRNKSLTYGMNKITETKASVIPMMKGKSLFSYSSVLKTEK